ncbi:MAG: winged helix-turn-helix domain-containing protein [Flavobacteriales bacterium]
MPWKPLPPEARERMERLMHAFIPHRPSAMHDERPGEGPLRQAMQAAHNGPPPAAAASTHKVPVDELIAASGPHEGPEPAMPLMNPKQRPERRKLTKAQEATIHALIRSGTPDTLGGSERLWSRETVRRLVHDRSGMLLPERTLSSYLERWGLAPAKPLHAMAAKDAARMRAWLKHDYPVIAMLAREAKGHVCWLGHAPLMARQNGKVAPGANHALAASQLWETGRFNILFVNGNRGHARWRVTDGPPTADQVIDLLERFMSEDGRKPFLILPDAPLYASPQFVEWALRMKERISLHVYQAQPAPQR